MEIVRERLEREFSLSLISTAPSVEYRVTCSDNSSTVVSNPSDLPPAGEISSIAEPYLKVSVLTPSHYTGAVMDLCQGRRGEMVKMEYLSPERLEIIYRLPLGEVVIDFFDQLKSRTQGYASLDYEPDGYVANSLVRVDVLLHGEARRRLQHHRPQGQRLQLRQEDGREAQGVDPAPAVRGADPGGRSVGRSSPAARCGPSARTSPPSSTAVTSPARTNCWAKQKRGKKRMKSIGRVDIPQEAFISALQLHD